MIGSDLAKAVLSGAVRQVSVTIDGVHGRRMHIDEYTHSSRVLQFAKLAASLNEVSASVSYGLKASDQPGNFIGTFVWPIEMDCDLLPALIEALRHTPLQVMRSV